MLPLSIPSMLLHVTPHLPDPVAAEGERLVNVSAAGLHPIVKALAKGTHYGSSGELPFVAGVDGVGRLEDGTRVYFGITRSPFGTFSELRPGGQLDVPAAARRDRRCDRRRNRQSRHVLLGCPHSTGQVCRRRECLILGATGVAGRLAIQIAKRLGARRSHRGGPQSASTGEA